MNSATKIQIQDDAVCISLCANLLRKGMTLSVPFPAKCKLYGILGSLAWGDGKLNSKQMYPT